MEKKTEKLKIEAGSEEYQQYWHYTFPQQQLFQYQHQNNNFLYNLSPSAGPYYPPEYPYLSTINHFPHNYHYPPSFWTHAPLPYFQDIDYAQKNHKNSVFLKNSAKLDPPTTKREDKEDSY